MSPQQRPSRIDLLKTKCTIFCKLGKTKAEKYFCCLNEFLSLKITKSDFDKLCVGIMGRENIPLHNKLISSIIENASLLRKPETAENKLKEVPSDIKSKMRIGAVSPSHCGTVCFPSLGKRKHENISNSEKETISLPNSIKVSNSHVGKGEVCKRNRKTIVSLSPMGPLDKILNEQMTPNSVEDIVIPPNPFHTQNRQEKSNDMEIFVKNIETRKCTPTDEGEEVEQVEIIQSKIPIDPPLGIIWNTHDTCKMIQSKFKYPFQSCTASQIPTPCCSTNALPDSVSLQSYLERRLNLKGLTVSPECGDLLNRAVDGYLKRLMKPCVELATAAHGLGQTNNSRHVVPVITYADFCTTMKLYPQLLGEDWPRKLEKICIQEMQP